MKKTYSEKLKDPRWQKKRLQILERDKFRCQICGNSEKTLHVHHIVYLDNHDPWDYKNYLLITICEECHNYISDYSNPDYDNKVNIKKMIADHVLSCGINNELKWFVENLARVLYGCYNYGSPDGGGNFSVKHSYDLHKYLTSSKSPENYPNYLKNNGTNK